MSEIQFLVMKKGTPKSPAYQRLAQSGQVVVDDGSQNPASYAMVVVDGGSLTPDEVSAALPRLGDALDHNVPVLLLDAEEGHKKALSPKVHAWSNGPCLGSFVYPVQDQHGTRRYSFIEQLPPQAPTTDLMAVEAQRQPDGQIVFSEPVKLAAAGGKAPELNPDDLVPFFQDIRGVVQQIRSLGIVEAVITPPAGCPYWAYPYKIYASLPVGGNGAPNATQVVSGTAEVGIYYDNLTYSKPVQWCMISNQGNYSSNIVVNSNSALGWSIGGFKIQGPGLGSSTQGDFSLYQSSPQSVSGQTTYTSSTSFTVGVAAGTDGLSGNASYTESNSVSYSLNDWEITLTGDDSWNFYQQVPYNGESQSFPSGAESGGYVASLPAISTSALSFAAQTVWLVMNPLQSTMPVSYTYVAYPTCIIFSDTGKSWHATFYYYTGGWPFTNTYNLDFGPANPTST